MHIIYKHERQKFIMWASRSTAVLSIRCYWARVHHRALFNINEKNQFWVRVRSESDCVDRPKIYQIHLGNQKFLTKIQIIFGNWKISQSSGHTLTLSDKHDLKMACFFPSVFIIGRLVELLTFKLEFLLMSAVRWSELQCSNIWTITFPCVCISSVTAHEIAAYFGTAAHWLYSCLSDKD